MTLTKEFFKKHKVAIMLFVLIGIIIIPLIIHILFKIHPQNGFFSAEWTAGDVLGFYGVLLGAAATVWGVFLTIQYTQSNYRQDLIDRSLPFITITTMLYKPKRTPIFSDVIDEQDCDIAPEAVNNQTEYVSPIDEFYFIIKNKDVSVMANLTAQQKEMIACGGNFASSNSNGMTVFSTVSLLYAPLIIENVGNGAATTFSVGLYIPPYDKEKNPHCFSIARSLKVGEKMRIAIYSENTPKDNVGDYDLCVSYYDIFGNQYEQLFKYRIFKNDIGQFGSELRLNGTQRKVD